VKRKISFPDMQVTPEKKISKGNQDAIKIGNYILRSTIGSGAFAKVKEGEHVPLGVKVAVKIINLEEFDSNVNFIKKIKREVNNMRQLKHPNVVKMYEVISTQSEIYIVMEYIDGPELYDHISYHGKLSENDAQNYFCQIISAVTYIHSKKVVHRDLKLENILLDKNTNSIKIIDFGLSNIARDGDLMSTSVGSPEYASPEIISGSMYSGIETDIWSCGVILYTLLTAKLPFQDDFVPKLFTKIREGRYEMPKDISEECRDLIRRMLSVEPLDRITMEEIKEHPWVKNSQYFIDSSSFIIIDEEEFYDDQRIITQLVNKLKEPKEKILKELETRNLTYTASYRLLQDTGQFPLEPKSNKLLESVIKFSVSPSISFRGEDPFYDNIIKQNSQDTNTLTGKLNIRDTHEGKNGWFLGIMSRTPPKEILRGLVRILNTTGFQWKLINSNIYRLKCRKIYKENIMLKIGIQVFKIRKTGTPVHIIDFKIYEGDVLTFIEEYSKIQKEIKYLNL